MILPVLVLFFVGIVDFGFVMNDMQQVNNATFRAARELAVDEYRGSTGCVGNPALATDTENLVCNVRNYSNRPLASTYVRVVPPATTSAGEQVLVCLATPARSVSGVSGGFVDDLLLRSARHVRLESSDVELVAYSDTLPAGHTWSWCS